MPTHSHFDSVILQPIPLSLCEFLIEYFAQFPHFLCSPVHSLHNNNNTPRTKSKSIYRFLDWSKPGKAIVVCIACICSVFIVHILVYCMYRCRVCMFKKFCLRERNFHRYVANNDDQVIYQNNQTMKARTPTSYEDAKPCPERCSRAPPVIEYRA